MTHNARLRIHALAYLPTNNTGSKKQFPTFSLCMAEKGNEKKNSLPSIQNHFLNFPRNWKSEAPHPRFLQPIKVNNMAPRLCECIGRENGEGRGRDMQLGQEREDCPKRRHCPLLMGRPSWVRQGRMTFVQSRQPARQTNPWGKCWESNECIFSTGTRTWMLWDLIRWIPCFYGR